MKKYVEPNRNNKNNYMLDTSAYNTLICSDEKIKMIKESISYGFCYFSTALQDMELAGKGAKTYNNECISVTDYIVLPEFKQKVEMLDRELNVQLVPEVASYMRDHFRVDGTHRFLEPESTSGKIFNEINSKNKKGSRRPFSYSHDAMIAEAAINYECILVSDDKELIDTINLLYPNRAITTDALLNTVNSYK